MTTNRLKHVASVIVSNVDKRSSEGQRAVRLCNYTDVYYHERITSSLPLMEATATEDQIARFRIRPGDVLITKDSETANDIAVTAYVAEEMRDVLCGYHLALLRPRAGIEGRYLAWTLRSRPCQTQFSAAANGITRFGLRHEAIGEIEIPVPMPDRQRAIADHLDRESARIDALIAAKRRMIALLGDRKGSVREAVLAPLKASSRSLRLGRVLEEVDCRVGTDTPPALLSVSIHHGVVPYEEANPDRLARAEAFDNYKLCRPGDLILNRMRAFQGGVGVSSEVGMVSPDYAVFRALSQIRPRYMFHVMRSPWFVGEMEARLRGIGGAEQGNVRTPRVNWNELKLIEVPVPELCVQEASTSAIERRLDAIVSAETALRRQLGVLAERRQALITAAVSGEAEIPGAAA